jgi:hypothetical protein
MALSVTPDRDKGIITMDDPICRITLVDTVIENGDEALMIDELNRAVARADPDLIMTERGPTLNCRICITAQLCTISTFSLEERRISCLKSLFSGKADFYD